jgi:hypothetical protein
MYSTSLEDSCHHRYRTTPPAGHLHDLSLFPSLPYPLVCALPSDQWVAVNGLWSRTYSFSGPWTCQDDDLQPRPPAMTLGLPAGFRCHPGTSHPQPCTRIHVRSDLVLLKVRLPPAPGAATTAKAQPWLSSIERQAYPYRGLNGWPPTVRLTFSRLAVA